MKCPYCGRDNDEQTNVCVHCFAGLPVEEKQEKPLVKKTEKKSKKE